MRIEQFGHFAIEVALQRVNPSADDLEYTIYSLVSSDVVKDGLRRPIDCLKDNVFCAYGDISPGSALLSEELASDERVECARQFTPLLLRIGLDPRK